MSSRTEVRLDRSSLFHWLTLRSFSVRTVTDTSKTTSYQLRRSFNKETTRMKRISILIPARVSVTSIMFPQFTHWYEGQIRIFEMSNAASHFRGIASFFIFFSFHDIPNVDFNVLEFLKPQQTFIFIFWLVQKYMLFSIFSSK